MTGHGTKLERMAANPDWVRVGGALSSVCNQWARRRDLTVYLGRDGGQGRASAFYLPDSAQIEINSEDAFGVGSNGDLIGDLTVRMELSKYPVCGGLAMHEAGHARLSNADWAELRKRFKTEREWKVYELLEETRIEGRQAIMFPEDVGYLRASTRELLMGDDPSKWSPRAAAQLLIGRHEVGILEESDVTPVESWLLSNDWSLSVLTRLREITREFLYLDDKDDELEDQIDLALELDKLMPADPAGDGDGSGEDGLEDAISDVLSAAARGGRIAVIEAAERKADADRADAQAESDAIREQNEEQAGEVFGGHGTGGNKAVAQLAGSRAPTGNERAAAVALARALESARYRDRAMLEQMTDIPPGRFNGGEAMRMDAARSVGGDTSRFKPFRHKRYQETDEPPLSVGIMSDVSGSMSSVQPAVGTAVWVVADAVYRIDRANAAAVYFGKKVYPGLRNGERLSRVRTWSGTDPWEQFDDAFKALDGELNLLGGNGARLLVVVSDGRYYATPGNSDSRVIQADARDRWVNTCVNNGVAVVWLLLRGQEPPVSGPGIEVVVVEDDILSAVDAIGSACIRALAHASGI